MWKHPCKRQVKEKKSETAKNECNSCNIVCVALSQRYNSGTIWVLVPLLIDVIRCQPYLDAERENLMWLFCMTNAGHGNNNNRWANFQIEFTSTKDAKKSWKFKNWHMFAVPLSIMFWMPKYCIIKCFQVERETTMYPNVKSWRCDLGETNGKRVRKQTYIFHENFYAIKFIQTWTNKQKKW